MKRRLFLVVCSAALGLVTLPGVGWARVDGGCAKGAGWVRFEAIVNGVFQAEAWLAAFPTNASAIDDGVYSLSDLETQVRGHDRNLNGFLCVKDVYAHNGGTGQGFNYYVNAVDDNPAP